MTENPSGYDSRELFERGMGITYADFTILNTRYSSISKDKISLKTDLGKGVTLELPLIAAPMDRVTNADVCIALALQGAIGVLHYNHRARGKIDVDGQIDEIVRVKRFQNGFIQNPVAVSPGMTLKEVIEKGKEFASGKHVISTFPVTDDGTATGKLVGILHKNDYRTSMHLDMLVSERMQPLDKIAYGRLPLKLAEANNLLWENHVSHLPIVDRSGFLKYLVTQSDIDKSEDFPKATKDSDGRLRVLFAVETWPTPAYSRLEKAFAAGADGAVIDTSQGFTRHEQNMIAWIEEHYPGKLIIGGNISTKEAAMFLDSQSVDAYRCGQGSGSICTTADTIGLSRAGATAVYDCAYALREKPMRTIADGGIRQPGDIVKALTIGAHAVMLGNMLSGTEEGPGNAFPDPVTGVPLKDYRGMGSKEANDGRRGYGMLPQGVSGKVLYKGSIHKLVPEIIDGVVKAFEAMDVQNIGELHELMYSGEIRFDKSTPGAMRESGVHDIIM
jgi:IMP dehydrogenase